MFDNLRKCKTVQLYDSNKSVLELIHDPGAYSFYWVIHTSKYPKHGASTIYSVEYDVFYSADEIASLEERLSDSYWTPRDYPVAGNLTCNLASFNFFEKLQAKKVPFFVPMYLMKSTFKGGNSYEKLFEHFLKLGCPFHIDNEAETASFVYYVGVANKYSIDFADEVFKATNFIFSEIARTCETLLAIQVNHTVKDYIQDINPKAILVLNVVKNYINLQDRRQVIATAKLLSSLDPDVYTRVSRLYDRIKIKSEDARKDYNETFELFVYYSNFTSSYTKRGVDPIDHNYSESVYLLYSLFHEVYSPELILKTSEYFEFNKNFAERNFVNFLIAIDHLAETENTDAPLDWVILVSDAGGEDEDSEDDDDF